jgi:hypothetical protein
MTIASLQHFGASFLSPLLTFFNHNLEGYGRTGARLYFLAREGYWLEKSYQAHLAAKGLVANSRYLLVSRAFLFKIGLLKPETYEYSLNFNFSGSLSQLMRTRFMLSDISIKQVFTSKEQQKELLLPADADIVAKLLETKISSLSPIVSHSADAYEKYLAAIGYFEQEEVNIVDIGYSGSIQKLLTILYKKRTVGHYLIASNAGNAVINNTSVEMKGYLKEGVRLQEGYLPLDRSMFIESLLTSPNGQFQDIRFNAMNSGEFDCYYGRSVFAQQNFHMIEQIFNGALAQVSNYAMQGVIFSAREVEEIIEAYVTKKGMFPQHTWSLFSIDDDISNTGTVNAIKFFGLGL